MQLTFLLSLDSDYHIGAGHGLGARADSALLRDGDRVPVLRGSSIEGLLRDGSWRLLHAPPLHGRQNCKASGGTGQEYCVADLCPVCAVFGTPAARKRWRISSARPVGAEKPLGGSACWQAGETATQIAARVRVNPRLRRAEARKLFKQEEGDARLIFTFTVTCTTNNAAAHDEAALLVAAARMVRRFGAARQRGRGECRLSLTAVQGWQATTPIDGNWQNHLLEHFKQSWLEREPPKIAPDSLDWATPLQATRTDRMCFRLIVRTDEPIVIARRAEAGNLYDCTEAINGVTLLGALAEEAAARWNLDGTQIYGAFLEVFRRGAVRFSPLYPAYYDPAEWLYPTVPAPLDLLVCKIYRELDPRHNVPQSYATMQHVPEACSVCGCGIALVPLGGFVAVRDGAHSVTPRFCTEMHAQINPHTRRAATGNLYGYVALEAGQFFLGELRFQDDSAWRKLCQLTGVVKEQEPFSVRLGKATRRGYGLVSAWLGPVSEAEPDPWRGCHLEERVNQPNEPITMTLLTDAIVPDAWGRFRQTLEDAELLEEILGNKPARIIRSFCKAGFVDNFNNHLGLPRWRDIALKAGSAVGFTLPATVDFPSVLARMRHIEEEGIGVRRNEGYGQVAFNHPVYHDGTGVIGTGFPVPEALRLAGVPSEGAAALVKSESDAMQHWADDLRDHDKFDERLFREEQWEAVARWLYSSADRSLDVLREQLTSFGKPSLLIVGNRDEKDHFTNADATQAIEHLNRWFERMQALPGTSMSKAIRLLADRLALSVERKEK